MWVFDNGGVAAGVGIRVCFAGMFWGKYVLGHAFGVCFGGMLRGMFRCSMCYFRCNFGGMFRRHVSGSGSRVCFGGMSRGMFRGCATRVPFET